MFVARVSPCLCSADDDGVHGFTLHDGARDAIYLAARRTTGAVRWLDLAISTGKLGGTIALRVWIDIAAQVIRGRVVCPDDSHPAQTLGGFLTPGEMRARAIDVDALVTTVVLGDDRLVAHLLDLDRHAAASGERLALPVAPRPTIRRVRAVRVAAARGAEPTLPDGSPGSSTDPRSFAARS